MSSEFKIGRLRFNWKGSWNPTTVYSRDDVIGYQGKTYVCLLPHTAGSNFSNDLNFVTPEGANTPYWNLVIPGKKFIGFKFVEYSICEVEPATFHTELDLSPYLPKKKPALAAVNTMPFPNNWTAQEMPPGRIPLPPC